MKLKTYVSPGAISFPVTIGKGYKRIRFVARPLGGAIYTTSDAVEQEAIEKHPYFGTLYHIETETTLAKEEVAQQKMRTVEVSDLVEARDYLMDNYEYKASDLRSRKAIVEAGEDHGIEFPGI